jgi:hypothetical protein
MVGQGEARGVLVAVLGPAWGDSDGRADGGEQGAGLQRDAGSGLDGFQDAGGRARDGPDSGASASIRSPAW